jgi:hypothetical protein
MSENEEQIPLEVTCSIGSDVVVRGFIMAGIFLAIGLWCGYEMNLTDKYPTPDVPFSMDVINEYASWLANFVGQIAFTAVGLFLLIRVLRTRASRLRADANGIGYVGKRTIAWNEITKIDASRLKAKGFLDIYAGDAKFSVDTWRWEQSKTLLAIMEANVSADKMEMKTDK